MVDAVTRTRVPRLKQWLESDAQLLSDQRASVTRTENRIRGLVNLLATYGVDPAELEELVREDASEVVRRALAGPGRSRRALVSRVRQPRPGGNVNSTEITNPRRQEVLGALVEATRRGAQQMTLGEVVMHLRARGSEAHDRTIRRDLEQLVTSGWLEHPDRGVYRLTDLGVATHVAPQ